MIKTKIKSQSGIDLKGSQQFYEFYDKSLDIRFWGSDNLYPQQLRALVQTSPSLASCTNRLQNFLYGEGASGNGIIDDQTFKMLCNDYSIFCACALFIYYNQLGDIVGCQYIPVETIRLGECGSNGLYTYCYYSPDWSNSMTVNKRRVNSKTDKKKFWMFTDDMETRLRRMQEPAYAGGEVLFLSNTNSYPQEKFRSCLNYISSQVGITNHVTRLIRNSFCSSAILSVPAQSETDLDLLSNDLNSLVGDENAYKVMILSTSDEAKPQLLTLDNPDSSQELVTVNELIDKAVVNCFNQSAFLRLSEGSLGFGSEAISEIYEYYNKVIKTDVADLTNFLRKIDPNFTIYSLK